ncbi:hypothetical protein Mapa_005098 [Marchantia paleacea]|nr:hypothetical protein Mapa_005098 [Marchantia paleacea]
MATAKAALAIQPCHFFKVAPYASFEACCIVQSGFTSRLRKSSTKKSMARVSHSRPLVQLVDFLAVLSATSLRSISYSR